MTHDYIEVFRVVDGEPQEGDVWYTSPSVALEHDQCGTVLLHGTAKRSAVVGEANDMSCFIPGQVLIVWRENLVS